MENQQIFLTRQASFEKQAISETKHLADVARLPPDFEIAERMSCIDRAASCEED